MERHVRITQLTTRVTVRMVTPERIVGNMWIGVPQILAKTKRPAIKSKTNTNACVRLVGREKFVTLKWSAVKMLL